MSDTTPVVQEEEIIIANTGDSEIEPMEGLGDEEFHYDRDPLLDIDNGEYDAEYQNALKELRKSDAETPKQETEKQSPSKEEATPAEDSKPEAPKLTLGEGKTTKTLKAKVGDGDLEIPLTAAVPVKVDGEETLVEIDELRRVFSSKQATRKEREAFLKEQRAFAQDRADLNRMVSEGLKAISEGKIGAGLGVFAEMSGEDPFEVIRGLRKAIVESARGYVDLSEEERDRLDKIEEAEYLREKIKRETKQKEIADERQAFTQRVLGVIESYGISDVEEYNKYAQDAFDYVQKEKAAGRLDKSLVVTPETVGNYYLAQKTNERVLSAVKKAAPEWQDDQEKLQAIWQYASQNRSSQEELISVILEAKNNSQTSSDVKASPEPKQAPKPETEEDLFAELEKIDPGLDLDKTPQLSRLKTKKK